ncbi:hypothetical protein FisN_2Lh355 [Fistulifera solaris]|uniref:PPC domain-containing protein n=1 Tax=Fistulifera solaris TaxID=1519565 RepID=A0A1Z5J818_FISSO|nr:hypothetical protein FisN_2Lh355 [Fistulifera solaris]|eukprot:GAX10086.1 hypothetical protein FisN_2Lh355 [Fistulifera solaris]
MTPSPMLSGPMKAHAVRLEPGDDLVSSLQRVANDLSQNNCFVISAVGSLSGVTLRMANATAQGSGTIRTWNENMEILSMVGTFAQHDKHLHLCLSDATGATVGGHLVSGTVYTTLELVLGTIGGIRFERALDQRNWFQRTCRHSVNV